ncbi:MAG: ABC transporter permease subunit [Actinobacteria bacterium]|nr:ABC transporter permease subunit [Actinomycetota bacterium]
MLLGSVFTRSLREQRRATAWWAIGLFGLAAMYASFWPSIRESADQFAEYMENLPEAVRALFGGELDIGTPEGYMNAELFALMGPLLFTVVAVGAGARAIAGEEDRGTLDLLLSTPVARWRLVVDSFGAMAAQVALLGVVLWAGAAGGSAVMGMDLSPLRLAQATLLTSLVGLVFGSTALLAGAATGRRGVAIGVAAALAVVTYALQALAVAVSALEPYRVLSPFHHSQAGQPLVSGLAAGHTAVLAAVPLVLIGVAVWAFERRDVAT